MKRSALVGRSLVHYARAHAGVLAGAAAAAAALVGALLVGDSVEFTLRRLARLRLGGIALAADTGTRFFRDDLAVRFAAGRDEPVAAALALPGMALREAAGDAVQRQVNRVRVLGVTPDFWRFADPAAPGIAAAAALADGEVAVNRRLAEELGVAVGDEISVRVSQPGVLPRDAPLAARGEETTVRLRARVAVVLDDDALGRFDLAAGQAEPRNAFLPLSTLQARIERPGRANLLLAGSGADDDATLSSAQAALRRAWTAADAGLTVSEPVPGVLQVVSERVFMEDGVAEAALAVPGAAGVLTYLVNELRNEDMPDRATPYSFVNAIAPMAAAEGTASIPGDLRDDEIVLNAWTAERLRVGPGGRVRMEYAVLRPDNGFDTRSRVFTVRAVLPMESLAAERALMPAFPGLTDVDSCAAWDVGLPMDEVKLKDPDNEAYWAAYRDTPKAFVTLAAGRAMWALRFGSLTAVRLPAEGRTPEAIAGALSVRIGEGGSVPEWMPVRRLADAAVEQARDLGELFLGMSFFLLAAALMLTALLFALGVDSRAAQSGLLRAVGWGRRQLVALYTTEAAVIAAAGAVVGAGLGVLYTRALLWALARHWQASVAGAAIRFHAQPSTIVAGAAAAGLLAALAAAVAAWRHTRATACELLAGEPVARGAPARVGRRRGAGISAVVLMVAAAALTLRPGAERSPPAFFAAGAAVLAAGLLGAAALARRWTASASPRPTFAGLVRAGVARRAGHGLLVVGLLAGGSFLALSVAAMRDDPAARAARRDSGTGGFALFADSTAPIAGDLASAADRRRIGWPDLGPGARVVALRLREGEDAGCLNLNKAQRPRVIGVDPALFSALGAFVQSGRPDPWTRLAEAAADGAAEGWIPALGGDSDTAQWGLGRPVGQGADSEIGHADEQGRPVRLRLVGALPMRLSLFQGAVLVTESDFLRLYPSEEGRRLFLVDVPPEAAEAVRERLNRALERYGFEAVSAVERLREFYAVEETYLSIFLALGGLGLLLGSAGMAAVAWRHTTARRPEWALLQAVGFARRRILRLAVAEYVVLVAAGVAIGATAAAVAAWPAAHSPGTPLPWRGMIALVGGMAVLGIASAALAARAALRAPLLAALRRE